MTERRPGIITRFEETIIGGSTWATKSMTFRERLGLYGKTGIWPGSGSESTMELIITKVINQNSGIGDIESTNRLRHLAQKAGLKIE